MRRGEEKRRGVRKRDERVEVRGGEKRGVAPSLGVSRSALTCQAHWQIYEPRPR